MQITLQSKLLSEHRRDTRGLSDLLSFNGATTTIVSALMDKFAPTQKFRGLFGLSMGLHACPMVYEFLSTNLASGAHLWPIHAGNILDNVLANRRFHEPVFARPAPISPRHGFVESRVITTLDELIGMSVAVSHVDKYNPGYVIVMKPAKPVWSAIMLPDRISFGRSNDGATSGNSITLMTAPNEWDGYHNTNMRQWYLFSKRVTDLTNKEVNILFTSDDDICEFRHNKWRIYHDHGNVVVMNKETEEKHLIGNGAVNELLGILDTPYLEIVSTERLDGQWPEIVQQRNGPSPARSTDFIPHPTVASVILNVSDYPDLVDWETAILKNRHTLNVVVNAVGQSLASHYCVHAILNKIPVITSHVPKPGEILQMSGEKEALSASDLASVIDGFLKYSKPENKAALKRCTENYMMMRGAANTVIGCTQHQQFFENTRKCNELRGISLYMGLLMLLASCIGEARHLHGAAGFVFADYYRIRRDTTVERVSFENRIGCRDADIPDDTVNWVQTDKPIMQTEIWEKRLRLSKAVDTVQRVFLQNRPIIMNGHAFQRKTIVDFFMLENTLTHIDPWDVIAGIDALIEIFNYDQWNSTYGGKAWADVVQALKDYYLALQAFLSSPSEELMNNAFATLNTAVNVAHNGGAVFTKFTIVEALDFATCVGPMLFCNDFTAMQLLDLEQANG